MHENGFLKLTLFRWKIKRRLGHLGALGIMGKTAPFTKYTPLPLTSFKTPLMNLTERTLYYASVVYDTSLFNSE